MRVSRIDNNQQTFNGINAHKAKRKALYGIAAACALFAGTCEFTYAKGANTGGYRSQYRTSATRPFLEKVKNFILVTGGVISMGGCLYSLKKAEDDREEEKDEKLKEQIEKRRKQNSFDYFEEEPVDNEKTTKK